MAPARARRARLVVVAAFAGALALACSAKVERPPAESDGSGTPGRGVAGSAEGGVDGGALADAGADVDAGPCNDLALTGLVVDRIAVSGDPPAGNGGAVSDGTYDLTELSVFVGLNGQPGPTGVSVQSSLRVEGTSVRRASRIQDTAGTNEVRTNGTAAAVGASWTLTPSCPATSAEQYTLTATPTSLVLVNVATREAYTYKKQ